jgi:acetyl esterase/lipase
MALNRLTQYRAILPVSVKEGQRLPVVYLLHGGGWRIQGLVKRFGCSSLCRDRIDSCDARGRSIVLHERG